MSHEEIENSDDSKRAKMNHLYIYDSDGRIRQVIKLKRTKGKGKSPRQQRLERRRAE